MGKVGKCLGEKDLCRREKCRNFAGKEMDGNMKEILLSMAAAIMLTFCGSCDDRHAGSPLQEKIEDIWCLSDSMLDESVRQASLLKDSVV